MLVSLVLTTLPAPASATPTEWPLGQLELVPGNPRCVPGFKCTEFVVSECTNVAADARGVLALSRPADSPRGLVVFFSGTRGTEWWNGGFGPAVTTLGRLRDVHDFVLVQIKWTDSWLVASRGEDSGSAHLGCRPATALDWVHENLYLPLDVQSEVGECGFCMSGNSGGASQTAYALSHYGLDGILDAVVPTSGPPHAALTKGCLPGFPDYEFDDQMKSLIDFSFGFLNPVVKPGPCATEDSAWISRWQEESPETPGFDNDHPTTRVVFIVGSLDESTAPAHAADYRDRLLAEPTNDVTWVEVAAMEHSIQQSRSGLAALEAALAGR